MRAQVMLMTMYFRSQRCLSSPVSFLKCKGSENGNHCRNFAFQIIKVERPMSQDPEESPKSPCIVTSGARGQLTTSFADFQTRYPSSEDYFFLLVPTFSLEITKIKKNTSKRGGGEWGTGGWRGVDQLVNNTVGRLTSE